MNQEGNLGSVPQIVMPADVTPDVILALNFIAAAVVDPRIRPSFQANWLLLLGQTDVAINEGDLIIALRLIIEAAGGESPNANTVYNYFDRQVSLAGFTGCGRNTGLLVARRLKLIVPVRETPGTAALVVCHRGPTASSYWGHAVLPDGHDWYRVVRLTSDPAGFVEEISACEERPYKL